VARSVPPVRRLTSADRSSLFPSITRDRAAFTNARRRLAVRTDLARSVKPVRLGYILIAWPRWIGSTRSRAAGPQSVRRHAPRGTTGPESHRGVCPEGSRQPQHNGSTRDRRDSIASQRGMSAGSFGTAIRRCRRIARTVSVRVANEFRRCPGAAIRAYGTQTGE
jgi:hypothetical protein